MFDCNSDPDEQKNLVDPKFRTDAWIKLGHELTVLMDAQIERNKKQKPGLVVKQIEVTDEQKRRLAQGPYTGNPGDPVEHPNSQPATRPAQTQPVRSPPAAGSGTPAQP